MHFGLRKEDILKIQQVLSHYPQVEEAILYGSRAKGNYRNGSDIDLSLKGKELTLNQQFSLENELDDLLLPYKMDISIFHQIQNPDLLDHIERVGKVFYERIKTKIK